MEAAGQIQNQQQHPRLSPLSRLSPRCLFNTSSPSMGSLSLSSSTLASRSPFGLSRQPSVSSVQPPPSTSSHHGRQGSIHSSTSNELNQYIIPSVHSRQSSTSTGGGGCVQRKTSPPLPPRRPPLVTSFKLSPTSLDMGYHTMATNGHDSLESPPFLIPPPPPPSRPPPPTLVTVDSQRQSATFKKSQTATPTNACHFDKLSDDLVLRIMSHLSTNTLCICARVSRRFYFLTWEPRLWSRISLTSVKTGDKALSTLLRLLSRDSTCNAVEKLSLNNCSRLTDDGLELVSSMCPELRTIELKNCKDVSNLGVQSLVTKCCGITHLDLSGITKLLDSTFRFAQFFLLN